MAVTIKQIAEIAGVSRGTVDRALNGRGGVNPEVERQIIKIAKQLDYKPNYIAKALANSRKVQTIGVIINSGGNSFFDSVIMGIDKAKAEIESFKIKVIVQQLTGYNVYSQLKVIDSLINKNISGLVITPINDNLIMNKLNEVNARNIPIVTLNADISNINKLAFVGCNYYKSGETAAELIGQTTNGNAKVGVIMGSRKMLGHVKRVKGFQDVIVQYYPSIEIVEILEGYDNDNITYQKTYSLLNKYPDLNCLYFSSGGIDGGIKAVIEHDLQTKIKIVCVDDTKSIKEYIKKDFINLTICQQPEKQGYDSIKIIFDKLIENKNPVKKYMYTQNEIKTKYNLE